MASVEIKYYILERNGNKYTILKIHLSNIFSLKPLIWSVKSRFLKTVPGKSRLLRIYFSIRWSTLLNWLLPLQYKGLGQGYPCIWLPSWGPTHSTFCQNSLKGLVHLDVLQNISLVFYTDDIDDIFDPDRLEVGNILEVQQDWEFKSLEDSRDCHFSDIFRSLVACRA